MRSLFLASVLSLTLCFSALAADKTRAVESLNDLPSHWTGVAGDLFSKVSAELVIERVKSVSRDDRADGSFIAKYDVVASLTLGNRALNLKSINMSRYSADATSLEMVMITDDELVTFVWGHVSYDEASDRFTLRDTLHEGQRRFSLSGAAKHR